MSEHQQASRRMIIIIGGSGEIIAIAGTAEDQAPTLGRDPNDMLTGPGLLPSQSLYTVEMPEEFLGLRTAVEKYQWLSRQRLVVDPLPRLLPRSVASRHGEATEAAT